MAIDFKALGVLHGYHLWMGGGDLFEARYLAEAFVPQLPRLRLLFVPLSYPILRQDNGGPNRQLAPWKLSDGDWRNRLRAWIRPVVRQDHWRHVAHFWLFGVAPRVLAADGNLIQPWKPWDPAAVDVESPKYAANVHLRRVAKVFAASPDIEVRTEACLQELIHFARQRGVRIIFYTPPYARAYSERMRDKNPELLAHWQQIIRRLVTEEHIEYHDFSRDPRFIDQPDYFGNEDHMNPKGAHVFSRELRRVAGL